MAKKRKTLSKVGEKREEVSVLSLDTIVRPQNPAGVYLASWLAFFTAFGTANVSAQSLAQNVLDLREEAVRISASVVDAIGNPFADVPGWSCAPVQINEPNRQLIYPIPFLIADCTKGEQILRRSLSVSGDRAQFACQRIAGELNRIASSGVENDLYRHFENERVQVLRISSNVIACDAQSFDIHVKGSSSDHNRERGFDDIDEFAAALLAVELPDFSSLPQTSELEGLHSRIIKAERAVAAELARLLPEVPNAVPDITTIPEQSGRPLLPRTMALVHGASVNAGYTLSECRVYVSLSTSYSEIREATARRGYANPNRIEGQVVGVFTSRNTERFVGQSRNDGSSIKMFVDDKLLVRIRTTRDQKCSDTDLVQRLFNDVLASDLSFLNRD